MPGAQVGFGQAEALQHHRVDFFFERSKRGTRQLVELVEDAEKLFLLEFLLVELHGEVVRVAQLLGHLIAEFDEFGELGVDLLADLHIAPPGLACLV